MFDIIDDIGRFKTGKSLDRKDFNEAFNLYMIQRWLSMNSKLNVEILNSTVNILYGSLNDKQFYMLMKELLPTSSKGRYIKNAPRKVVKKKEAVDLSAAFEESSSKIEESIVLVLGEDNG